MFTFVFIDDSEDIVDLGKLILETSYQATVRGFTCNITAMDYIKNSGESCDAVICDYNMGPYNGGDIYKAVREHRGNLPFILMSGDSIDFAKNIPPNFLDNRYNVFIEKPFSVKFLRQLMLGLFQGATICSGSDHAEYCGFPSKFLSNVEVVPATLFARLGENKFIPIAKRNEPFCFDLAMKLSRNSGFFYTTYSDFEALANLLLENCNTASSPLLFDEVDAVELSLAILNELGVSPALIHFAMKSVSSILKAVEMGSNLKAIFSKVKGTNAHQLYQHSVLAAFICVLLAKKTGLSNRATIEKLCLASLFHDSALSPDEFLKLEIAPIKGGPIVKFKGPNTFYNHPLSGSLFFKGDYAYTDVSKIIEQHHERPDGKGFPKGLGANSVHPLSALFIVSENFSNYIIATKGTSADAKAWINLVFDFYHKGRYKNNIVGLKSIIDENE